MEEGVIGYPLAATSFSYFMSDVECVLNGLGQTVGRLNLVFLGSSGVSFGSMFASTGLLGGRNSLPPAQVLVLMRDPIGAFGCSGRALSMLLGPTTERAGPLSKRSVTSEYLQ